MPKVNYQRETVQITVYVVRPTGIKHASNHDHRRPRRRHQALRHSGGCGYDRKAQLLKYSREMRALASREPPQTQKAKEAVQTAATHKPQRRTHKDVAPNPKPQQQIAPAPSLPPSEALQTTAKHVLRLKPKEPSPQPNRSSSLKAVPVEQKSGLAQAKLPPTPSCLGGLMKVLLPGFISKAFGGATTEKRRKKKKMACLR
ncbi:hypothetical protein HPP92_025629 [Vanilla planifolia]|uniref:Uncharacterized protein n=1 Tax=Vanilla planifolia TaxID=51239 RepID=A0A835PI84_VANPL|nr:hypothetical protein HPP92_025885 [Vanilla planifolia]KAG0454325.1 hypothetical protein HPP92_025629 [Vanilla planifolia]